MQSVEFLGCLTATIAIAFALDWAVYWRMLNSFGQVGEVRDNARWSRTMLPRSAFTLAAAMISALAIAGFLPRWWVWFALPIFFVGQVYALVRVWRD